MWHFSFLSARIVSEPAHKVNVFKANRTQNDSKRYNLEKETSNMLIA